MTGSGKWRVVGEGVEGGETRPYRPSGEGWREKLVIGLVVVVDEWPFGVVTVAGEILKGTEVLICCLGLGDSERLASPMPIPGVGAIAVGAMSA